MGVAALTARRAPSYNAQVGAILRRVRNERGLSLRDLEQASCGQWKAVVVGSYERGDRQIRADKLAAYAAWLGVPVATLLPPEDVAAARSAAAWLAADRAADGLTTRFPSLSVFEARRLLAAALSPHGFASEQDTEGAA